MKAKSFLIFLVCVVAASTFYFSCLKPPQFSETPEINFVSINSTNVMEQTDSIKMVIGFKDGDGDLGVHQDDTSTNCFITDIRPGKPDYTYGYRIPFITPNGTVKDISGQISISLPGITCIPGRTIDSVTYKIKIRDRVGHLSNEVETPLILVTCQ